MRVIFSISLILILLSYIPSNVFTANVIPVKYESQADLKVFVVKYESQADLCVYKTKYESEAKDSDELWYFVKYQSKANAKIYFVKYESQSDLKIYYVSYKSQAKWKKANKWTGRLSQ